MKTFNLETRQPYSTRLELVSTETIDNQGKQPWISGIYLVKGAWEYPTPPNKFSICMTVDRRTGLLDECEIAVSYPRENEGHSEWFVLTMNQLYLNHCKYKSEQQRSLGAPTLDGVWIRRDAFVGGRPPSTLSVQLWVTHKPGF